MFKPTYLYVKTHNVTGLKYFGKTVRKNPQKYLGSGCRWKNHLKVHGNDISTEIIGYFTDEGECKRVALKFSKDNDIVNSKEWANLKEETLDGGWDHINNLDSESRDQLCYGWVKRMTKEERSAFRLKSVKRGEDHHMYGKHHTEETLLKLRNRVVTEETRKRMSESRKYVKQSKETKEKTSKRFKGIPKSKEHNKKNSEANKGNLTCYDIMLNAFIRISKEEYDIGKNVRYFNPNSNIVKQIRKN